MGMERKLVSYKDVCLGVNGHNLSEDDAELFAEGLPEHTEGVAGVEVSSHFLGDPLCPVVRLSEEERKAIQIPWRRALLVKLLGKRMGLKYFHARLIKLWQLRARLEDGPWMLADHYIVIQTWQPGFSLLADDLRHAVVWVRVSNLPIEFYDRRVLWRIGNVLGKTVKIDANTLRESGKFNGDFTTERAKFAHIYIEVDLNNILVSKFLLEGRVYPIEYEGLHLVCFKCGRYGHKKEACPLLFKASEEKDKEAPQMNSTGTPPAATADQTKDSSFGPWMLAHKPQRRNSKSSSVVSGMKNGDFVPEGNKGSSSIVTPKVRGHRDSRVLNAISEIKNRSTCVGASKEKEGVSDLSATGPSKKGRSHMGLNLKSQVRFKNIKQAAHKWSDGPNIPLTVLNSPLIGPTMLVQASDPPDEIREELGNMDSVEVFNHRPLMKSKSKSNKIMMDNSACLPWTGVNSFPRLLPDQLHNIHVLPTREEIF
ncbi:Zinc finger, CCHC-type [Sesbania bispinosa]|nr:Zinc finger, CCHC-type [Sesbania bispinosa]